MFGGYGRGRGYGATLGYCPWTGMPKGWRWNPGYYLDSDPIPYRRFYNGTPYETFPIPAQNTNINEKESLEREYKYLQERLEDVKRRLDQLQK